MRELSIGSLGRPVKVLGVNPALPGSASTGIGDVPTLWTAGDASFENQVLLYGFRPRVPRPVKPTATQSCASWVKGFMRTKGYKAAKPLILHAYQVDLDGDGVTETLVEVASRRGLAGAVQWKSTDYSAVLLRAVIGGRARVFALGYAGNGNVTYSQNRIRAIVDLEGDGVMEVVTSWAYYEGDGSELWRYSHGRVRSLAEVGQGL